MATNDERVLVLAPTGQDAPLVCEQLAPAGMVGEICADLNELADGVLEGAAAALIAEEALEAEGVERLLAVLRAQPAWSDLPIAMLAGSEMHDTRAGGRLFAKLAEVANLTLLERPLRVVTLVMTVQAAVRSRRRQYEFREYLQEYEHYQEQLTHTQKLESLGVLAGGIAHDFNNLLTGILGNVSLVADMLPASHPGAGLLNDAIASSERAAKLTSQMLAYAGKGRYLIAPVDLSVVAAKLDDFFRASIPKRVALKLSLPAGLPVVEADESQIEQLIMNLVLNAAEAIPEGRSGHVTVSTGVRNLEDPSAASGVDGTPLPPGSYVSLRVEDDGIGMDQATLARIFDPFFSTKFLGRGLGLAAVQGVVRAHRGGLAVESRPGRGTTFTVLLPEYQSQSRHTLAESGEQKKGPVVIVVDDEEIVRRTASAVLEQNGYRVICAEHGKAAADIVRTADGAIDVVLLDMTMPEMDGAETFAVLKSFAPAVKVILSSGYNENEALRRFTGRGLAGFIQKPYTNRRLLDCIKRVLAS
jgi:signal transduction histidine kinase/CheY-like chemotaxis protein